MARSRTLRGRSHPPQLLLTCEHAGNRVPAAFKELFLGHGALLDSHRGYDLGAFLLARHLRAALHSPLLATHTTRLLVEANRSLRHPDLFSAVSRNLDSDQRQRVIDMYYTPHRHAVIQRLESMLARGPVVHVGVHTFTPVLRGAVRKADIGLLFDPRRAFERSFCLAWQRLLKAALPELVIRRNSPYRGVSDGLTTAMRKRFRDPDYAGVELEVNNRHLTAGAGPARKPLMISIAATLRDALHLAGGKPPRSHASADR